MSCSYNIYSNINSYCQVGRSGLFAIASPKACPDCGLLPQSFPSRTYVHAIVWGQIPRYRLILAISPLAIMTATMIIILVSLYKARYLDLDYIASFNAMDSLHLITACSSGNVHTVSFPDYSQDIGLFSKDVEVGLSEKKAGSGATGFHFSLS